MKSPVLFTLFVFLLLPSWCPGAPSGPLESLADKLDRWEVEEAWTEVQGLLAGEKKNPQMMELASQIAFYRGDYPEALKLMKSAISLGGEDDRKKAFALFVEETIGVVAPFKKYETPHFVISLEEKQNGILADYVMEALEKTYRRMAEEFGFQPREKIRVEIFPDTKAFYFASSLSARDIEVAGAVGLASFNKLMILSPGALVYGYRWLDALSHEYLHYLIVKLTGNKAPIWFHEGLAKYAETYWRDGPSYLSPLYQTLLARALLGNKLIGFERMEPSLVQLETPEEVQLAYAQAASAVEFIISKAGREGIREIMKHMASSNRKGAGLAIRDVLQMRFAEFEQSWKEYISARQFKEVEGVNLRRFKIKEGQADEERLDMEEIKSRVARNRAHLGDLLQERGRLEAAVLEYGRALAETRGSVPVLNKLSGLLIKMGRDPEALELIQRARDIAPDHPILYDHLGKIYLKLQEFAKAREALQSAIQINPFNPDTHQNLATACRMLGDPLTAQKELEISQRLKKR